MNYKSFMKTGHPPTLFSAFLYFDMSFMVWVLLGPLGIHIARDLGLTASEKGLMVAIPVLSGAIIRFFIGILVDRMGAKKTGAMAQFVVIAALAWAWIFGLGSLREIYIMGMFLGVAGASFAVALPLASRWYPPEAQGLALGIAGAGNSGTVLAALFAPLLANHFGWNAVFGLVLIPLTFTWAIYMLLAKDSPESLPPQRLSKYFSVLKENDTWWFMFFYLVTFGGFVGLASSLVIYFNSQFGLTPSVAGYLTAACVFAGSLCRPIGGILADRIGGIRSLQAMYTLLCASMLGVIVFPGSIWMSLIFFMFGMVALGIGNGSVFQLIPQRFRREIGVMTGLVGMAGGLGGFYLAASLGFSKHYTGDYRLGFAVFGLLGLAALVGLFRVKARWRTTWGSPLVTQARI